MGPVDHVRTRRGLTRAAALRESHAYTRRGDLAAPRDVLIATPNNRRPSMFPLEGASRATTSRATMDLRSGDCQGHLRHPFPRSRHSPWMRDSIQKFRPAGRVNVKNASAAAGFVGEPSTILPVASSIVWRSIEPATYAVT